MNENKFRNKLKKYIQNHDYNINENTLNYISNKMLKDKNIYSKIMSQTGGMGGEGAGTVMASEYYGVDSGSYSGTETGTPSFSSTTTRPEMLSKVFPLKGGSCSSCNQMGGCGCGMGGGGMSGGMCPICIPFFAQKDIKELNKSNFIRVTNKQHKNVTNYLNNNLSNILHNTFYNVKNKSNLVGRIHFQKALKIL
jgi:hypothetical protein